jgi:hypothetical protein
MRLTARHTDGSLLCKRPKSAAQSGGFMAGVVWGVGLCYNMPGATPPRLVRIAYN